eukprot:2716570-Heterocapsa_arctica.AAC.1
MADVRDGAEEGEGARGGRRSSGKPPQSAEPGKEGVLRPGSAKDREAGKPSKDKRPRTKPIEDKADRNPAPTKRGKDQRESHEDVMDHGRGSRSRDRRTESPGRKEKRTSE